VKIKCIAPWAGGKRRLAKRIVELLWPHDTYIEPFVGGCSILPVKPRAKYELLGDFNENIVRVLRGVRDDKDLQRKLMLNDFLPENYASACAIVAGGSREHLDATLVLDQLIAWWMGPNGLAGTNRKGWFAQRHTETGGCPAKRWDSFRESIPALQERLAGVLVHGPLPWQATTRRINDQHGTAIYLDPPYFRKSFKYTVDFTEQDHRDLAAWANSIQHARIVVSYDDAPELAELYPESKWRRVRIEQSKNMAASLGKSKRNVEMLLVNDIRATS
jgi:DNA adenine methylase